MPKNQIIIVKGRCEIFKNDQQLLKHIMRVFPSWNVLWLAALQLMMDNLIGCGNFFMFFFGLVNFNPKVPHETLNS